ncbi:hypothetical protein [Neobacillus kokaensis]|uniref:SSD domain-containing protein n=1 Tax=Neobacillus kokaensis TaxID=2759023 RepID=A0ABQ3N417_9BACI|nr:hypothetical protein [Neobacillus kokaensis]GHH98277.1 hypothetical protein AM1BK_18200 [Neobacillus kokaensis]
MRFLYKRPKAELVYEELDDVMEVMASDVFIFLDLFLFSLIFTLLLAPVIDSLGMAVLFFIASYSLFSGLYFFVFKKMTFTR